MWVMMKNLFFLCLLVYLTYWYFDFGALRDKPLSTFTLGD